MTTSNPGSAFSREKRLRMVVNVLIRYSDDHAPEFLTDAIEILESLYQEKLTNLLKELEVAAMVEDEAENYLEFMRVRSQLPMTKEEQQSFFSYYGSELENLVRGRLDRVEQSIQQTNFSYGRTRTSERFRYIWSSPIGYQRRLLTLSTFARHWNSKESVTKNEAF